MQPPILKETVEHLEVSEEIKNFMVKHEIKTLNNLLDIQGAELLKMDGFSYRMLQHLLAFLNDHDCLHLFKEQ